MIVQNKKSLYQIIVDDIVQAILNGDLKRDDKLPTEQEFIDKYEVSRITVRRALQDLEDRDLILRRKGSGSFLTGVFPQGAAQGNLDNKIISLAIPFHSNMGGSFDLIRGIGDYLGAEGYVLTIDHMDSLAKERDYLLSLDTSHSAGCLFYPSTGNENLDVILQFDSTDAPIVFLDKYFEGSDLVSVMSDNHAGTRDAVKYLVSQGHREIAFVSYFDLNEASSVRDRFRGYCAGLRDAGLKVNNEIIIVRSYEETASMLELLSPLFDHKDPVTAIVSINDYMAIDIIRDLTKQGIKVPEDVSVIGFDNVELGSQVEPPITTVDQNFYEIGVTAARSLLNKLRGAGSTETTSSVIATELIVRNSTARPGSGL